MQLLSSLCLMLTMKLVPGVESIHEDQETAQPAISDSYPTLDKRYVVRDLKRDRYNFGGGNMDSFRFFHRGLGKRSEDGFASQISSNHNTQMPDKWDVLNNALRTLKENILGIKSTENVDKYGRLSDILRNSKVHKDAFRKEKIQDRVPEIFSPDHYQVQTDEQQMDVNMDRDFNSVPDVDSEINQQLFANPADLNFSGIDMSDTDLNINHSRKQNDESEQNGDHVAELPENPASEAIQKRWWAGSRFNQLREPRTHAYNPRSRTSYVDPALYFLGLGK